MKISLLTLGCKVNQAEVSLIEGALRGRGFEVVGLDEGPELCVINTCTVTAKSDYQSRQLIRRAQRAGARVLVTGCYSELNKERVREMDGVEEVVANDNKSHIIKMIAGFDGSDASYKDEVPSPLAPGAGGSRTRFFLKVQDGCNHACSYCVIPRARGASRSISPQEVVSQVDRAVAQGYKEVVLSGIHLGLYGQDLRPALKLSGLVEEILEKTSLERLRLSSLEIREINDSLIGHFEDRRLMRHLHIPLQSGDDGVLRLMNRNYDTGYFKETVGHVVERLQDLALGTDVIVGFPGEGEREFEATFRLLEELPFTYLHVFPFSPRPGTPASLMPLNSGDRTTKERVKALRALSDKKKKAYISRQVGRTLDILMEEELPGGVCRGTSSNYLKVQIPGVGFQRGSVVPVRVEGIEGSVLVGKPLNA
jgi:threonylcarbamoyladenosine tRNA methylthiotransferase MtaB